MQQIDICNRFCLLNELHLSTEIPSSHIRFTVILVNLKPFNREHLNYFKAVSEIVINPIVAWLMSDSHLLMIKSVNVMMTI